MRPLTMVEFPHAMVAAVLLALCSAPAAAQDTLRAVLVGPGASIGASSIAATVPIYGGDPSCGEYADATALSIAPSLVLKLPALFSETLGAGMRAGLSMQSSELTGRPADPQRQVDPRTGELVEVDRSIILESRLSTLQLDALIGYTIGGLSAWAGPTFGIRVGGEVSVRDEIARPDFANFGDGTREREVTGATRLERATVSFGGVASVAYSVQLGAKLIISPHADLRIEPASPYRDIAWSQITVGGGVDLLFDLTPSSAPPPVVAVAPPPRPVQQQTPATLEMRLRSLDTNGELTEDAAEVLYREVVERRHVPLIGAVFFDSASSSLPQRLRTLDPDAKPTDIARTLAERTTLEVQADVLNVLGERLRANPRLSVTLIGSWSSEEDRALARARAGAVREYLLRVWRLDAAQVNINDDRRALRLSNESLAEGRAENRRVEIVAASEVLRPVFIERTIDQAVLPVRLRMDAVASFPTTSPATRWRLEVSDGSGRTLRLDSVRTDNRLNWPLSIDPEEIPSQATSLMVRATALGFGGAVVTSQTAIPLSWRREQTFIEGGTERSAERERTTWQVLGFGFNASDLLDHHREEIRTMAELVRTGARIVVTGYSDRLGDEKRNLELSRERAERVAATLREEIVRRGAESVEISAIGAGVDETRFSNDLPEGRFLSRGATIVIEQGVR